MPSTDSQQWNIHMPLQAAGTSRKIFVEFVLPGDWFIESIDFMPDDGPTQDNTDFTTWTLENETDSQALDAFNTTIATGVALVAGTARSVTPTEGSARILSQSDSVSVNKADSGAGQAGGGTYCLQISPWRA